MKLKNKIIILGFTLLANIIISLSINADLLDSEKKYQQLDETINGLRTKNQKLNQQIAQLTSITRVAQEAEKLNISTDNQKIVFIIGDRFAKR